MSESFDYKTLLGKIPHKPGVYQFYDGADVLIYIGKAKDLKNRVTSYFNAQDQGWSNHKTRVLVRHIRNITFTIVDTEIDAWLLENSLIKKHQPRYNILLKDDKTYPSIIIKNERFPRVFWTRTIVKDGSTYFGPYASVGMMHIILDLIRGLFPLRNCSYLLSEENVKAGKFKVCLEYQIGNCKGPCQDLQSEEEYNENINIIKNILKGNLNQAKQKLTAELNLAISDLKFEKAHYLNKKLDMLAKYQSKSTIVNPSLTDIDVFAISSDEKHAFINYLKVVNGTVNQTQTIEVKKKLDESDQEILVFAIADFRLRFESTSKEIIVPFEIELAEQKLNITIPKMGDKKSLLDLSFKNVNFFKKERLEQYEKLNPDLRTERLLTQMKNDLQLTELPIHIECFDNSNFQGNYPVSAMVVFKNAQPSKKEYRHYNVKTVEGPNDFATMEEVVYRRYKRLLEEDSPLPQLILIDGGKGQLSSALKSLEILGISNKVAIIGIAKRLEEIYYPHDSVPLYLDKKSETLHILQQLRDEAHRFGITFHRKKRDKGTLVTELDKIEGIGPKTASKLLTYFKSVKKIKELKVEELREIIEPKKAEVVFNYFEKQKSAI